MKRNIFRRVGCILVVCCMLLGCMLTVTAAEPFETVGDVTPSDTAYSMVLTEASGTFIRNKKEVDLSIGKRYCLVYTVDEVTHNKMTQNGVLISQEGDNAWPYEVGTMNYTYTEVNSEPVLFEEGATYFYRVEVSEEGFNYIIAKKGKNDSHWVELPIEIGDTVNGCKYFGIWVAGTFSAKLSSVLCYDEDGNDLGVDTNVQAGGCSIYNPSVLKEQKVDQYYEFSLDNATNCSISNEKPTDSDVVYISYTVENVKKNAASQAGVAYSNAPKDQYPHGTGILNYQICEENQGSPLFVEGARYLIYAENQGDTIQVLVRRTINGKTDIFAFPNYESNEMDTNAKYFSIWIGEGTECGVTADIKNFQFYDKNGKNLGVQTNKSNIEITKFGAIEDYTYCEAVYWCRENNTTLILDDEQNMGVQVENGESETKWYKYSVTGAKLTMSTGKEDVVYDYQYSFMYDVSGNKYIRLKDTKVTFVTGMKEHEGNVVQNVTAADGYKVTRPEDPKVEGYTFKEWCLSDGSPFDFEQYLLESVTLYAKYADGDGHEYLVVDGEVPELNSNYGIKAFAISASIVFVTVGLITIMLLKGKQKNEQKN